MLKEQWDKVARVWGRQPNVPNILQRKDKDDVLDLDLGLDRSHVWLSVLEVMTAYTCTMVMAHACPTCIAWDQNNWHILRISEEVECLSHFLAAAGFNRMGFFVVSLIQIYFFRSIG